MRKNLGFFPVVLVGVLGAFSNTMAAEEKVEGYGITGEVQFAGYVSRHKSEKSSHLGKILYLEKEIANDFSGFVQLVHYQDFTSAYIGVAKKFGDFQVAIGAGPARYGNTTRTAISPWVYYAHEDSGIEALVYGERYRHEKDGTWFYKGYFQKSFGNGMIVGAWGESEVGIGPMLGYKFTDAMSIRITVPVTKQPDEARVRALILLTYAIK